MTGGLTVAFDAPASVQRGEFVIGVVRITNTGSSPCTISARLNLFEGDLRVALRRPDARLVRVHGAYQVDSPPRTATLAPGERLESGVSLFFTSAGLTFDSVGEYELRAEYDPSVRVSALISDPRRLVVHEPTSADGRALAEATLDAALGRALAMADASDLEARKRLHHIAASFAHHTEGRVAALVLAAAAGSPNVAARLDQSASTDADIVLLAHWVSALATPASPQVRELTTAFTSWLDRQDAADPTRTRARAIAAGSPFRP